MSNSRRLEGGRQPSQFLLRDFFQAAHFCLLILSSHGRDGSGVSVVSASIPFMGALPSWLSHVLCQLYVAVTKYRVKWPKRRKGFGAQDCKAFKAVMENIIVRPHFFGNIVPGASGREEQLIVVIRKQIQVLIYPKCHGPSDLLPPNRPHFL